MIWAKWRCRREDADVVLSIIGLDSGIHPKRSVSIEFAVIRNTGVAIPQRLAGIPARYVSGYLAPNPDRSPDAPPPELASHAWVEALLPGAGWTGFDPTHRTRTMIRHIRVAVGRDYNDLPPVSGVYNSAGGTRQMAYELKVSQA